MFAQVRTKAVRDEPAPAAPDHEFLVVGNESDIVESVAVAVRQVKGRLNCAPRPASAMDYIARRKIDGIVIDMRLSGALELIHRVRNSSTNRGSVIFACLAPGPEAEMAIRAGANFILHRPLALEKIVRIFNLASAMMVLEKRRCFRYPLMIPVELTMKARRVESTMSNLSEGGMAIWSLYYHIPGSTVQFAFEIPYGGVIRGDGQVAWTNADGLAGIKFHILPDQAYTYLSEWISRRDGNEASI